MASSSQHHQEKIEEIVSEDDEIMSGGDDEEAMMMPSLDDYLVTDDGDNIATGLVKSLDKIARMIDTQNKILIKVYTLLAKSA